MQMAPVFLSEFPLALVDLCGLNQIIERLFFGVNKKENSEQRHG